MRIQLKKYSKKIIKRLVELFVKNKYGRYLNTIFLEELLNLCYSVNHNSCELSFYVPNSLIHFRVETFSTKEPETLEWIDGLQEGSVLWDIGANIGLYSCYAAKKKLCDVMAFEPSVFNLEQLAKNIYINKLVNKITIFPMPLSESSKISSMNMSNTDLGGALSTFCEEYGDNGQRMEKVFSYKVFGIKPDDLVEFHNIKIPKYIKMDVDGIEHLILLGSLGVLKKIDSIIIEVNEDFVLQKDNISKILTESGLTFKVKKHSDMFENNNRFGNTYNQIWNRMN